jgi:hypothetical protein
VNGGVGHPPGVGKEKDDVVPDMEDVGVQEKAPLASSTTSFTAASTAGLGRVCPPTEPISALSTLKVILIGPSVSMLPQGAAPRKPQGPTRGNP